MPEVNYENAVQDGELIKWDVIGKSAEGVLVSYAPKTTSNGEGNVYELKTKDGTRAFFAPSLLHGKLKEVPMHSLVKIVYLSEDKTNGGNKVKKFNVAWTKATPDKLKALGIEMYDHQAGEEEEVDISDIPV